MADAENFRAGVAKEYHVWDAMDVSVMSHKKARWFNRFQSAKKALRLKMQRDPEHYFDYFAGLLQEDDVLTADITPSYCGLDAARLAFIRDGFARRGIATKAIFLIRDPLSRIKSAVRYNLKKGNYNEGIPAGETSFHRALTAYFASEACRVRTSYQHTIRAASSVFAPADFYVGIYETMFESAQIARLSEFCGVTYRPNLGEVFVKKTDGHLSDDPALDTEIRDAYVETYKFCHQAYPDTKALWS
ncbi:hypothetical protein [Sedimentimonas flavescens]|uniref:hypothetical protein n=1 Tax=Sedimentimonas flavescens TaxID=2851012 RepID=UPI0021A42F7F|nr:hypothetical protein [Sedimentimonas flavescens]MCT2541236.1 hypothetical protein [Sedimentimonas flavescens]